MASSCPQPALTRAEIAEKRSRTYEGPDGAVASAQVSSTAPSSRLTMVSEDSAPFAVCWSRSWRNGLGGFVVVDPVASMVPVSLNVSMVVEGFHGNRGLVP